MGGAVTTTEEGRPRSRYRVVTKDGVSVLNRLSGWF